MKAAGISGPDTLSRKLTPPSVGDHTAHREGVAARDPVPLPRGPPSPSPACIQNSSLHPLSQRGFPEHRGAGGAAGGEGGRPAHWTRAAPPTRTPPSRAPSSLSSLPPVRAPLPQARPGPSFPQSRAKASRPIPHGCGEASAHLPPSPSPATESARRARAFSRERVPCSRSASPFWRLRV